MSADDDPRDELLGLVGDLRQQLERHARAGSWGVPAARSARSASVVNEAASTSLDTVDDAELAGAPRRSLAQVRAELGECTRCNLSITRDKIVFGVGAENAPLVFVGEAPGADEDRAGEPFVGPAGQLLDKMIVAMGWRRQEVYIANVLKCRPPGNRNPAPAEVATCRPFLDGQLRALAPRIVVARSVAFNTLSASQPLGQAMPTFTGYSVVGVRLIGSPCRK